MAALAPSDDVADVVVAVFVGAGAVTVVDFVSSALRR
jgi:hypothetical protein